MTRLVVATRSADKLREIRELLGGLHGFRVLDLEEAGVERTPDEGGVEAFDSFRENALAKARYYAARCASLVLADDSGLCVDALGGAPGVYSKRFSGRDDLSGTALDQANNRLLLERMRAVPPEGRGARYVCVVALLDPATGREIVTEGTCEGVILDAPRGSGGFGYDPLFFIPRESATFGELPLARKNQLSHRAGAVRAAAVQLRAWHLPG